MTKIRAFTSQAQLSIEFLMMTVMGFAVLFTALYVILAISNQHHESKAQDAVYEMAQSIQQELLLANTMHEGYTREITLPANLAKQSLSISSGQSPTNTSSYIVFTLDSYDYTIETPVFSGTLHVGENTIKKLEGDILLIQ